MLASCFQMADDGCTPAHRGPFLLLEGSIGDLGAIRIPAGLGDRIGEDGARSFCAVLESSAERHPGCGSMRVSRRSGGRLS